MAKKKQMSTVGDVAHAYMKRAAPRFRKKHGCTGDCEFCAGWTWGAVDGYLAAARQAKKIWPRRRAVGKS